MGDILPITVYGDAILKQTTEDVKNIDGNVIEYIQNMFETMRNGSGIGLAANQVGWDKSVFVTDISPMDGYETYKPLVMINPEIIDFSDKKEVVNEGCLSIPYIQTEVERPYSIGIKYLDTNEKEQQIEASGFWARLLQHEYDHLKGILMTDRITPDAKKKLHKELSKIIKRDVQADYPITEKR